MVESLSFSCISICVYLLLVYFPSKSDAVPFTDYGVTQSDLELGASRAQATIPLGTPFRFSGQSYSSVNVSILLVKRNRKYCSTFSDIITIVAAV